MPTSDATSQTTTKSEVSIREQILRLDTRTARSYERFDLNRLIAFVIATLDGLDIPTTLENIAVAAHRLFPKRFAMIGYPEYPDALRVNRALLQLRPKYRNWATGKTRLGWALNEHGMAQARAVAKAVGHDAAKGLELTSWDRSPEKDPRGHRTLGAEKELERVRQTPLFAKYRANWEGATLLEVFDVLNAYTHSPPSQLSKKLRELRGMAADANAADILEFLKDLPKQFSTVFEKR